MTLVKAVERVLGDHPRERVLCHSVSYALAQGLVEGLSGQSRPILTYTNARERAGALAEYRASEGAVLVASSMDRGIDLPDEACRVQIVLKVPYPSLGDKQVAERLYSTRDGKTWYAVEVARSILQMSGRGVRHVDDYCECVILDSSFVGWYGQWQRLLPAWWRQAVRFERG